MPNCTHQHPGCLVKAYKISNVYNKSTPYTLLADLRANDTPIVKPQAFPLSRVSIPNAKASLNEHFDDKKFAMIVEEQFLNFKTNKKAS